MAEERHDPIDTDHRLPWPEESDPAKHKKSLSERIHMPKNRKPLYWFLLAFAILVVVVVLVGWLPKHFRDKDIGRRAQQQKNAKPVVETTTVHPSKQAAGLVVPGTTIPLTQAYVYARANGYLKTRYVDIGDHVKKNQLLAVIDAPDLDAQVAQAKQQVFQAERQLEQQKSQLILATVTVQRYRVLVAKGVFSRQDGDTQEANYASQVANVQAAQRNVDAYKANLDRQLALQSYEQVRAPFTGVISERDVDMGALISAGVSSGAQTSPAPQGQTSSAGGTTQAGQTNNSGSSGGTSSAATSAQSPGQGGPLFGIQQVQRLRILVSVPEGYVTSIHRGQKAPIEFQEYQGLPLFAEVTRTANSIDPNTRTMLTELQIDNSKGKLVAGMYAVVTFPPAQGVQAPLLITGDAIAIRHDQSMVAKVVNEKIHFVPVTIGRDFGSAVEILSGLKADDVIVTDVTDEVVEGVQVQMHPTKSAEEQPKSPPKQNTQGGSTQYSNEGLTDQNLQGQQAQQNQKSQGKSQSSGKKNGSESKQ